MFKSELRKLYLDKMKALTPVDVDEMSKKIAGLFFENFTMGNKHIHVFLSISKNNEVNTFFILHTLLQSYNNVTIAVPKSDFTTGIMKHYHYDKYTKLQVNKWGIPEPEDTEEIKVNLIDMVLVPLLCFDVRGYRVGYGKGFYDRFLSTCRGDTKKIGLSFFPPVNEINDINTYDIKLDACITPYKVYCFDNE